MKIRPYLLFACVIALFATAPILHASSTGGLILDSGGSITSTPSEVIDGTRSIKGFSSGTTSFTPVLRSDPTRLPFQRNQTYRITFRYKILSSSDQGLNVYFYSSTAGAQGSFVPGQTVSGSPGTSGTLSLTATLGPFDDYVANWSFQTAGSVVIDDVQIVNASTGKIVATEDAEPGTELLSSFFVSANKTAFIWGEPVKVTAALYDENATVLPLGPVTWTVSPAAAASIAADGTLTPLVLTTFTVNGSAQGFSGTVQMQSLPSQIVVTPEKSSMAVGSTQKVHASVLDVNSQPIPNAVVNWSISSQFSNSSNSATIDSTGLLKALLQARIRVVASVPYNQVVPGFDVLSEGYTLVDIDAPTTYKFERIFVSTTPTATSSKLAPRSSMLVPTESGGFMFAASLDGLGTALLEWNNGQLLPVLPSGRINLTNGYPLENFVAYGRTSAGNVIVEETDLSGSKVVSGGLTRSIAPLFASGSAVFGAQNTYSFDLTRNSVADSGAMLLYVGYTDAVTHLNQSGLFRGFGGGISEPIVNTRDSRIANGSIPAGLNTWGIANDGTAWFIGGYNSSLWRSRIGQPLERLLSSGQQIGNATISGMVLNYGSTEEVFFVAGNGDVVNAVNTNRGVQLLLWHANDTAPSATLAANTAYGVYWYDPSLGALIDADLPGGKGRGLYLWNGSSPTSLLLLNDKTLDGSPVQEIVSATNTSDGTVYVMARTSNSPMVIARLKPSLQVLLSAEDDVPVTVPPMVAGLIPGARTGMPLVIAGGATGSIASLDESGNITPVVAVGTKLPDGKYYAGSKLSMVRSTTDGRIVFGEDYFNSDSSLFTWNQGTIELTLRAPLKHADGTSIGSADNVQINKQGDIAFNLNWNCCGVYRIRNGKLTTAIDQRSNITVDDVTVQNPRLGGMDEAGNMVFTGTQPDGTGFYIGQSDGNAAHLIMSPGYKMPDGRQVASLSTNSVSACSDGFVTGVLGTVARYQNGAWNYLADPSQKMPTGDAANTVRLYDNNRNCDTAFTFTQTGGVTNVGARVAGTYDDVQNLQELTASGDLLTVVQMLINDDGTIYVLGGNDQGQEVIYRATPLPAAFPPAPSSLNFQISDRGGISNTSAGTNSSVQVGFAQILPASGSAAPSGMAIFGFRPNGILISEAAVPASPLIQSGRIYAEIAGPVDTGIAIANPNSQAATISFYYTDGNGVNVLAGKTSVAANSQISAFLDQAPFIQPGTAPNFAAVRTFTFTSSLPVGVTALRGYTNERSEFLITTLPVSPISGNSTAALAFPHFADGAGWTSAVVLINPGDSTISGTVQFYSNGTTSTPGAPVTLLANGNGSNLFSYSIAPRSAFKLQTAGGLSFLQTGWVRVTPSSASPAPSGLVVFSFQSNGVRVSEAGVPALPSSSAFRMYVEASGSVQSGIAISNPGSVNATVNFELTNLDGTPTGITGSTPVPATGQVAMFLNQIPGFSSLPASFKGVLRVTGSNIYVTGLRGRYNERGDFLITTTSPVDEMSPPSNSQFVLPQLADGGGYTTQIILFSGPAGQSASGVLQFVSQSGQPLGLLLHD